MAAGGGSATLPNADAVETVPPGLELGHEARHPGRVVPAPGSRNGMAQVGGRGEEGTVGQRWVAKRPYERALLLSLDLNLLLLWVILKYYVKWDPRLAPPVVEPVLTLMGACLCPAGAALTVWGKIRLGRWFSATVGVKEGHELVTDGPYAVTRHPIYSGVLAMLFGAALAWNSALTLLLELSISLTLFFHTVYEELLFEKHLARPTATTRGECRGWCRSPRPAEGGEGPTTNACPSGAQPARGGLVNSPRA